MDSNFEYISTLQYRLKAKERQLAAFESGEKYQQMKAEYRQMLAYEEKTIKKLEAELAAAHAETVTVRNNLQEALEDLEKEKNKELEKKDRVIAHLMKRIADLEEQRDAAKEEVTEKRRQYYEMAGKLEAAEGLNQKLTAQVNKDFQNSSIPSSQQGPRRKTIPNSREKTEKKRGGQPGHIGRTVEPMKPTEFHTLPTPEKYLNDPDYYDTGEVIKKQKIILVLDAKVVEYEAKVYRSRTTGARVHAPFPEGYVNRVNYDSSVKAAAFLLANECDVSAGKIRTFLSEVSEGKINISEATINGLVKEFSEKAAPEREQIDVDLMTSPVLNVDFTTANVNGETKQVLIVASPSKHAARFYARDHKGHKGLRGSVIENYVGKLVHDHDITFYSYGLKHQECMQHNCRYAVGSKQNEPDRTWVRYMHFLFQRMLHYRKSLGENDDFDPKIITKFERLYDKILLRAEKEYDYVPPTKYYMEGYNLYLRLQEYKDSELLFLHDKSVPPDNSLAERLARVYKRKQKQAIVLRSDENFAALCDSIGIIYSLRSTESNFFRKVCEIFSRPRPKRVKPIEGADTESASNNRENSTTTDVA